MGGDLEGCDSKIVQLEPMNVKWLDGLRKEDSLLLPKSRGSNQYWVLLVCVTAEKLRIFCLQIVDDLALCYFAFPSACDFAFILFYNFYKLYLYI